MAQPPPVPASSNPVPPALVNLPIVIPGTWNATVPFISFLTQLWAALAGDGGVTPSIEQIQAEIATIFGMHGDGTLDDTGLLTVTKTNGVAFGPFATGTDAADLTGTVPFAALPPLFADYTVGTLPVPAAGEMVYCTDLGGGAGLLEGNGTAWQRTTPGYELQPPAPTLTLETLVNGEEQRSTAALAANMVVTLSEANSYPGARFRWARAGAGAFTLAFVDAASATTIYTSAANASETVEFISTGANWYTAQHSLL